MHGVTFAIMRTVERLDDKIVETTVTRKTYKQVWPAYNAAQVHEKELVQLLLRELCSGIVEPPQGRGRPRMPLSDLVYAIVAKVYSTMSSRRASSDVRDAAAKGHMTKPAHYNTITSRMNDKRLAPLMKRLVEDAARPLRSLERSFAADATGFGTSVFDRWYDHKWGKVQKRRTWLKAHALVGTRTNVIASIEVTEGNRNDSPELAGLVNGAVANGWKLDEVSADKQYLSNANLATIEAAGAVPYIPLKVNSGEGRTPAWRRLWGLFWYKRATFDARYHQRSNVESSFSAIKRLFGGNVRAKVFEAQRVEVLAKCLAYNLTCLVHEIFEAGFAREFRAREAVAQELEAAGVF